MKEGNSADPPAHLEMQVGQSLASTSIVPGRAARNQPSHASHRFTLEQMGIANQPASRAGSLVLQTYAAKKVLKTGIGMQAIQKQVRLQGQGKV